MASRSEGDVYGYGKESGEAARPCTRGGAIVGLRVGSVDVGCLAQMSLVLAGACRCLQVFACQRA